VVGGNDKKRKTSLKNGSEQTEIAKNAWNPLAPGDEACTPKKKKTTASRAAGAKNSPNQLVQEIVKRGRGKRRRGGDRTPSCLGEDGPGKEGKDVYAGGWTMEKK